MSKHTCNRLVYMSQSNRIVTIDYHATLRLFLSQQEHYPFSAERILRMLNDRIHHYHVQLTAVGKLYVVIDGACCVLTQQAAAVLKQVYRSRHDLQCEFPLLSELFAGEDEQVVCFPC